MAVARRIDAATCAARHGHRQRTCLPGETAGKTALLELVRSIAPQDRIVLDPGIGFGKTVPQNLALLAQQSQLLANGHAILAGWSRKSTLGAVLEALPPGITDVAHCCELLPHDRSLASVAAAVLAVERGARIVRVHDVAATRQALAVWRSMQALDVRAA